MKFNDKITDLQTDPVSEKLFSKAKKVCKRNKIFLSLFVIMNVLLQILIIRSMLKGELNIFQYVVSLLFIAVVDIAIYHLYFSKSNQMSFEEISYLKNKIRLPKIREEISYTIGPGYINIYKNNKLIKYEVEDLDDLEKDIKWMEEYSPHVEYRHYRGLFVIKGKGKIVKVPNK